MSFLFEIQKMIYFSHFPEIRSTSPSTGGSTKATSYPAISEATTTQSCVPVFTREALTSVFLITSKKR